VILHSRSFCIWAKTAGKQLTNIFCCYSKNETSCYPKNSLELHTEDINKNAEVSTDGRLISILFEYSNTIQIWYNKYYQTATDTSEFTNFSLEHESNILTCRFKPQNFFETVAKYIPNVLITITEDYKVHLWIESFVQSSVEFYRFEIITAFASINIFPMFTFARKNTKGQVFSCSKEDVVSKLINPKNDRIYLLLRQSDEMGISKVNYPADSDDWVFFITVSVIIDYRMLISRYIK